MEISPTIWWILGLLFVYLFGLFEGRGQGYKRRQKEDEQEAKEKPFAPIKPATVSVDDPGVMRIKNEQGVLTLDLDGARVNPTAINSDQRKRLIEILNVIRPWLEGKQPTEPQGLSARIVSQSRPLDQTPSKPAPVSPAPPPLPPVSPPSQPVAPRAKTAAQDDRPVAPANSIVGQIDSILQTRIAGTPLVEQGVFLTQSPEGGVVVYVGLSKYMGVDEVPDAQIKAAIRDAIAEWEKKYTPGL
jgi:hypothetical protein